MRILEAIYIKQILEILDGLLVDNSDNRSERYLERTFLFAMMWTLGAVLEIEEREKLEDFLLKHPSKMSKRKHLKIFRALPSRLRFGNVLRPILCKMVPNRARYAR